MHTSLTFKVKQKHPKLFGAGHGSFFSTDLLISLLPLRSILTVRVHGIWQSVGAVELSPEPRLAFLLAFFSPINCLDSETCMFQHFYSINGDSRHAHLGK